MTLRVLTGKSESTNRKYVFALALLPYGLRSMPYIGFSLKKFAGPQENP